MIIFLFIKILNTAIENHFFSDTTKITVMNYLQVKKKTGFKSGFKIFGVKRIINN